MVVIKSYPELSDQEGTRYLTEVKPSDIDCDCELQGEDVVSQIFHRPLSQVVGCRLRVNGHIVTANYRYSEQSEFPGRAKAFHKIHEHRDLITYTGSCELTDESSLGNMVAFDCESGGTTKIRVITFYDGEQSWYIDCRDLKSNPKKRELLCNIFTSDRQWIAHNFAHDCELVCSVLKIPYFPVYIDTITLTDGYEFRNLGYLSGVVLGVAPYKHELEIANNTKDFKALIRYCAKDSLYTWHLSGRVHVPKWSFVNQFIHTMLVPPQFELKENIYNYYPEFKGKSKKFLRAQLGNIDTAHVQKLLKAINLPKPKITLHSIDGFNVSVPDSLTYRGKLYMQSSCGATDPLEIMANYPYFKTPEVSAYRFTHKIEPKFWEPLYNIPADKVFLVNDVVCLTTEPREGFTECEFDSVRRLFYGH